MNAYTLVHKIQNELGLTASNNWNQHIFIHVAWNTICVKWLTSLALIINKIIVIEVSTIRPTSAVFQY